MKNSLQAKDLSCSRQQRLIFSSLCFNIDAGHLLLVQGSNGSGKSSLLRLLSGIASPLQGMLYWNQQNIDEALLSYQTQLHYLNHVNGIKLGLTVIENLQMMAGLFETTISAELLESHLQHLELNTHQHQQAKYLSAGQKRRIALLKLFLFPRPLWILDEPLTALDDVTQSYFKAQLTYHLKNNGIAVISSHHAIDLHDVTTHHLRLG
jgi:heme exporter protein A